MLSCEEALELMSLELDGLLEVLRAIVQARGWTWEQLELVRQEKAAQRGGFEKNIFLKEVREK